MSSSFTAPISARQRYSIDQWSEGLFDVSADGLLATGFGPDMTSVALREIVREARRQGLRLPMLLRFPGILRQRAAGLRAAFEHAIDQSEQTTTYTPVYPIKVNQQATVVRTLAEVEGMGLEVGSKPELITALAVSAPGRLLICNGYKDAQYIRLALSGQRLGLNVMLVIEKPTEWPLIVRIARELNIQPQLGVRLRLSALGKGNWQNTGGERAKFGLTASQLLELIEHMRIADCLDWFQLL
ncbi:MAG: arginine decarboxylase, partial [Pseudomonadota bacterium]